MRRNGLIALAVVAFGSCGVLLAGGKATGESELKKLQGTWQFVSQDIDGKARPAAELAKIKITFIGDKWSVAEGDKVLQAGTHKLDPSKTPAQVDAKVTEGEGKGSTMLGIYELKGDTLQVNFDPQGKERPKDFKAAAGLMGVTIKREKK